MTIAKKIEDHPVISLIILCVAVLSFIIPILMGFYELRISNLITAHKTELEIRESKHHNELEKIKKTIKYYKIEGRFSGQPYIDVLIYLDNPPENGKPKFDNVQYAFKAQGGASEKKFEAEFRGIPKGKHSVDVYVRYPGNNPTLVEVKLIKVIENWNKEIINASTERSYIIDNYSRQETLIPSGMHHRESLEFVLD